MTSRTARKAAPTAAAAPATRPHDAPAPSSFRWAKWQSRMRWRRGRGRKPSAPDRDALLAENALLALAHEGSDPRTWRTRAELEAQLGRASFERGDAAWWRTLFATAGERRHYVRADKPGKWDWDRRLDWAVQASVAFRGLAATVESWLDEWSRRRDDALHGVASPVQTGLLPLNELVATADDASYRDALAAARRHSKGPLAVLAARLFDSEAALVGAALDAIDRESRTRGVDGLLIGTSPLDLAQLQRLVRGEISAPTHGQVEALTRTALNWIDLHGDKALPFVLKLLDAQGTAQNRRNLLAIVRDFDSPKGYAALFARFEHKDVPPVVQNAALAAPDAVVAAAQAHVKRTGSKPVAAWLARFAKTHAALAAR